MIKKITAIAVGFVMSSLSFAYETGADTTVTYVYASKNGGVFVMFAEGSLPGCYQNRGAYIAGDTPEAKAQLYSGVLAAKASKAVLKPLYDINNPDSGQWSMCTLAGIYFY